MLAAAGILLGALLPAGAQGTPPAQDQGPPGGGGQQHRQFRGNGVFGRIESISATEMKIAREDGSTVTVAISSKTQFRIDQQPAKLEDFKAGSTVFVRGNKTGDNSWDAEFVSVRTGPPPGGQRDGPGQGPGQGGGPGMAGNGVIGTVKAVEGTKITILRLDGTTQTIEVDENTSLQKHRESITLADIHAGDAVAVRGESKDGAFVPKAVNLIDPAQLERMKQYNSSGGGPPAGTPPQKPEPDPKPQGPF